MLYLLRGLTLKIEISIFCSTVCLLLGLVLPCLFSCFVFIFTSSCTMAPSGWLFWFILLPIGLFLLLSFYASATCLLVTIHKQYDAYVMKFNLRKALFQHFILELLCSISFVATALYIAIWSACPGKTRESSLPVAMWVEEEKKMTRASETGSGRGTDGVGRNCDSPLLYETEDEGTTCTNWMNTTGDSDHHERRLLSQQINTNHILSPADKILNEGLGHVYDNMSTLSRLRTERDEADDAYYSYTLSRRYKPTTFTS
ncbi:hypothetical protein WR25_22645 [Diploscapter pachys]|uniref:Uncharacterized protein n=1 Tax=Diploscapter pachys TaxID=2018661 RepID=A0A2A2JBD2_9BILA|nr:hypothetical protein WR25_22645 [Diploscapter pachys]